MNKRQKLVQEAFVYNEKQCSNDYNKYMKNYL